MNIACVTDAWKPQVNGVVRTLETVAREAEALGHRIHIIHPGQFRTLPCPGYPEIRLAAGCRRELGRRLEALGADRNPYRHRGAAGLGSAALVLAQPADVHHLPAYPFPRIPACPLQAAGQLGLESHALVSRPRARRDGGHAFAEARAARARHHQHPVVDAGRGHEAVPARPSGSGGARQSSAPDPVVRGPRFGGEEPAGLS